MADETAPKNNQIVKKDEKEMVFVPFGGKDPIRLTIQIVKKLIAVPTKNGNTCSDEDAMRFIMMCSAKRLNPFEQDAFLIGYDTQDGPKFSLITAHQAFLKRAEVNAEYDGMQSGVIVKRGDQVLDLEGDFYMPQDVILGGWATVHFKNRSKPMHKRIRLERFNTGKSQWAKDPAGMICKCAEADALRSSFPTMLGGLYMREEIDREEKAVATTTPIFKSSDGRKSEAVVQLEAAQTPQQQLGELIETKAATAEELIAYLKSIGMAGDDCISTEQLTDDNVKTIIKNWADVVARITESRGQNAK